MLDCEEYRIFEKEGVRVGIFSLAEEEWVEARTGSRRPEPWQITTGRDCSWAWLEFPFMESGSYGAPHLQGEPVQSGNRVGPG